MTSTNELNILTNFANIFYQNDNLLVLQTSAFNKAKPVDINKKSVSSFGTFNLGLHVNDDSARVIANRCQLLDMMNEHLALSVDSNACVKQIHWLNQVHGNHVIQIDQNTLTTKPADADAMTTKLQGRALAIMTADCVPIVLSQPTTGQVAAIHAGWKGLANGVIAQTVKQFDVNQQINAWVGSCISVDNYEVSQEVVDQLCKGSVNHFPFMQTADKLAEQISKPHEDSQKAWLDIQKLANMQLECLGCHVQLAKPPCSYGDEHYYSYRKKTHLNQANTGRMAMIVVQF